MVCKPNCAAGAIGSVPFSEFGYPKRMASKGHWVSRPYVRTALESRECLGWAVVTHPFHPLLGQRFLILKSRICSGRPTLVLEGGECGTFSVLREWTDRETPDGAGQGRGTLLAQGALLELAALLDAWRSSKKKD